MLQTGHQSRCARAGEPFILIQWRGSRCRTSQKVQAVTKLPVNGQVSSALDRRGAGRCVATLHTLASCIEAAVVWKPAAGRVVHLQAAGTLSGRSMLSLMTSRAVAVRCCSSSLVPRLVRGSTTNTGKFWEKKRCESFSKMKS